MIGKQISLILRSRWVCLGLIVLLQSASAESYRVSGVMDRWDIWHFASDLRVAECTVNSPCVEADFAAEPFIGPMPESVNIPVSGMLQIGEGSIVELSLVQSKPVAFAVETAWEPSENRIHINGLSWKLENGMLRQVSAAVVSCEENAGQGCRAISMSIRDPANRESPLDFDGIPKNFPIQNGALVLNAYPAFSADLSQLKNISLDVAAHAPVKSKWPGMFNAASLAHFTLQVEESVADRE